MLAAVGFPRLRLAVAGLWTVSLWTVGIAAATLSAVLADRAQFGAIVSELFRKEAWFALACGLAMLVLLRRDTALDAKRRRTAMILTVLMLVCGAVYFVLQPVMANLREVAGPGGVMASEMRKTFMLLHFGSMIAHLIQAILGMVLVLKSLSPKKKGQN
jgi:uncharacterized membrane protein (DUF485 family)